MLDFSSCIRIYPDAIRNFARLVVPVSFVLLLTFLAPWAQSSVAVMVEIFQPQLTPAMRANLLSSFRGFVHLLIFQFLNHNSRILGCDGSIQHKILLDHQEKDSRVLLNPSVRFQETHRGLYCWCSVEYMGHWLFLHQHNDCTVHVFHQPTSNIPNQDDSKDHSLCNHRLYILRTYITISLVVYHPYSICRQ